MLLIFFFFNNTATTEIYTLSLHDALPISVKLLIYALEFLNKNDYTRYIYSPKIDELFMARQHDKAMADNTHKTISIHDTIKEGDFIQRSEEHTSELQSRQYLVCRLLLEKKKKHS